MPGYVDHPSVHTVSQQEERQLALPLRTAGKPLTQHFAGGPGNVDSHRHWCGELAEGGK